MEKSSKTLELYKRYEYLAQIYSSKVFNEHMLGMERLDLEQEFKVKIWTSIVAFKKKWKEYRLTNKHKPIPLPFYIKANLNNLKIDLSKKINGYHVNVKGEAYSKVKGFISIEQRSFDFGRAHNPDTSIDLSNMKAVVRGVDFLQGLGETEAKVFCMFLKGHTKKNLSKIFKGYDVSKIINEQCAKIRFHKDDLITSDSQVFFSYSSEIEE